MFKDFYIKLNNNLIKNQPIRISEDSTLYSLTNLTKRCKPLKNGIKIQIKYHNILIISTIIEF